MTIDEINRSTKEVLTPADIAPVLGADPYGINRAARENPEGLGFPVIVIGNRVKIPRRAFLHWMLYGRAIPEGILAAYEAIEEREEVRGNDYNGSDHGTRRVGGGGAAHQPERRG